VTPGANLILIGMPASGKSTVGVLAAKALGLDFVDTDLLLQKQEGRRLHQILVQVGPDGFLALEDRLLAALSVAETVVSTGGSAVYHRAGMDQLKRLGPVVWIDVPYPEIERRLGDIATRGVVLAPGQTLRDLYDERRPLYERWADHRLESGREDLETTVGNLVRLFR
jgi:shikimate kinase